MKTQKLSLRKIVSYLNNPEEEGGFWLPNIQRPFVWTEVQICRLFDSILRQYPISTLLIWKTKSGVRRRKFIDNFKEEHRNHLSNFKVPDDNKKKCLVLDGQQRLQSLFIGLRGSYDGKELYLDVLSGDLSAPDDVKFKFAFLDPRTAIFPHVRFRDIVFSDESRRVIEEGMIALAGRQLTKIETDKIKDHIDLILNTFLNESGIGYQELDSIEQPKLYKEDDVVEIFIRANSGGTRLDKSDLLFSLLTSSWDEADGSMEILLDELNMQGFAFTRDFILKTCLTLLDQGARYEVDKFRKAGVREGIEGKWDDIVAATKDVADFVRGSTFIRCDKALSSYLVLIPLVYLRYHFPSAWATKREIELYLLRALLAGAFGGTPDQLIDDLVYKMKEIKTFDLNEMFGVIRTAGRSLELTEDRFWAIGYNSENIHLLFNLWYRDFNYTPAFAGNLPQVDHVFPQSLLRKVKVANPNTGKINVMKYREGDRNQLANCMLLTAAENGAGGKSDTPPDEWFKDKTPEYLAQHLIPADPELWKIDHFDNFIDERKKLIKAKFAYLLSVPLAQDMQRDNPSLSIQSPVMPQPENGSQAVKNHGENDAISGTKKVQLDFWNKFKVYASSHKTTLQLRKTDPQHWYTISIGNSKASVGLVVGVQDDFIRCELYIPDSKKTYKELLEDNSDIEKELGVKLEWQELPGKKACRIKIERAASIKHVEEWPSYFEWLKQHAEKFQQVFGKRLKNIKAPEGVG